MKRSSNGGLRLVLMGGIPLAAVILTTRNAEPQREVTLYESAQACEDDLKYRVEQCVQAERSALVEHQRVRPQYTSASDCETDYGQGKCESTGSGHSPQSGGFLLWYLLAANRQAVPESRPVYRDRAGRFRTADGTVLGSRTGRQQVPQSTLEKPVRATTVSRSGFGHTNARSYGGGG